MRTAFRPYCSKDLLAVRRGTAAVGLKRGLSHQENSRISLSNLFRQNCEGPLNPTARDVVSSETHLKTEAWRPAARPGLCHISISRQRGNIFINRSVAIRLERKEVSKDRHQDPLKTVYGSGFEKWNYHQLDIFQAFTTMSNNRCTKGCQKSLQMRGVTAALLGH